MKFPSVKMSKDTKQTLLAGITGGLVFHMEEAANGLIAGYPQILKDRIDSNLPRNGQLVADVAPLAVGWVMYKRRPSPRNRNIRNGLALFDLPKLMHQIVWNVAYTAGRPVVGARFARPMNVPMRVPTAIAPPRVAMRASAPAGSGTKYVLKNSVNSARASPTGMGKYR